MNLKAINTAIAEKIMGWTRTVGGLQSRGMVEPHYFSTPNGERRISSFQPSSDISDAWQVVEKLQAIGWDVQTITRASIERPKKCRLIVGAYSYELGDQQRAAELPDYMEIEAETAPLAICLAALQALGVEIPE